jgi:hypothetical protein
MFNLAYCDLEQMVNQFQEDAKFESTGTAIAANLCSRLEQSMVGCTI